MTVTGRPPRTSWSCCSTTSASPTSAATAPRSPRPPSTAGCVGLRYSGFHTTAMCSTTRAALLTGRNHHDVGVGCLANFDSGFRLPGQDQPGGGHARRAARPPRLPLLPHRQVARDPAHRDGGDRPLRRLAAAAGLPPLLRLPRRRDRPVRAGAGLRQPPRRPARHLRGRLPPVGRPGRPHDRVPPRPPPRRARRTVAHLARVRGVPRPAPGAQGADRPLRVGVREGWDATRQERLARQIEMGLVPAGTELPPRNERVGLGRPQRGRAAGLHPAAGRLRSDARPRRPPAGPGDRLPRGDRSARRHAGAGAVRQRRVPGGRAVRVRQRHGPVQRPTRAHRGQARPPRLRRRAGHPLQLPVGLGHGGEHPAQALQAEHPRRRHP